MDIGIALNTIASAIGGALAMFMAQRYPLHAKIASFEATNLESNKRDANRENDMAELKTKYTALQEKYDAHFSRESLARRYAPSEIKGLLIFDGHYFCSKCFPELLTRIAVSSGRFHCVKCQANNAPPFTPVGIVAR